MAARKNVLVVGLTGPTGAGKSTVAKTLQESGAQVIDADAIAREIVDNSDDCKGQLREAFGVKIFDKQGKLDRQLLANLAFSSKEQTDRLNVITHPAIVREIELKVWEYREKYEGLVILDAALLLETGLDRVCDEVVSVIADAEMRIQRVMQRDRLERAEAVMRLKAQKADEFYTSRANFVIYNDSDAQKIYKESNKLASALRECLNE